MKDFKEKSKDILEDLLMKSRLDTDKQVEDLADRLIDEMERLLDIEWS